MKNQFFYLMLIMSIVLSSCSEDEEDNCCDPTNPECENYDPCFGKEEPNAKFFTEDRLIWPESGQFLWINDSILRGGPVRFRSPFEGEGISHTWYIGAETLEETSVTRNFSQVPRPDNITVSHVITYPVDTLCYPFATGRDSVAQTFYLIDFISELLTIESTFRGVINNQVDSFDFKLRALQNQSGMPAQLSTFDWGIYMINFGNSQDSVRNRGASLTNTHLAFSGDFSNPTALLIIDPEDSSVEMTYSFTGSDEEFTFKGRLLAE
ncbi:MAG: hypothetical protein AAGC47_05445 [Bacteroidota bacterium]